MKWKEQLWRTAAKWFRFMKIDPPQTQLPPETLGIFKSFPEPLPECSQMQSQMLPPKCLSTDAFSDVCSQMPSPRNQKTLLRVSRLCHSSINEFPRSLFDNLCLDKHYSEIEFERLSRRTVLSKKAPHIEQHWTTQLWAILGLATLGKLRVGLIKAS